MAGPQFGGAHAPITRSLEDVLSVGVHAIRHALHDLPADDTGDLRSLFACAEKAIALSDDRPSVELMLDVLRQSAQESGTRRGARHGRSGGGRRAVRDPAGGADPAPDRGRAAPRPPPPR